MGPIGLLVFDAKADYNCRYFLLHPRGPEKVDGDEEEGVKFPHTYFDYDHIQDYPRGYSSNQHGSRGTKGWNAEKIIAKELAKFRLGYHLKEQLLDVTNTATKKKGEENGLYQELSKEIKAVYFNSPVLHTCTATKHVAERHEVIANWLLTTNAVLPAFKTALLAASHDYDTKVIRKSKGGKLISRREEFSYKDRCLPYASWKWNQHRRFLWAALDSIVLGFFKNYKSGMPTAQAYIRLFHRTFPSLDPNSKEYIGKDKKLNDVKDEARLLDLTPAFPFPQAIFQSFDQFENRKKALAKTVAEGTTTKAPKRALNQLRETDTHEEEEEEGEEYLSEDEYEE